MSAEVLQHADRVEVVGRSGQEVVEALALYDAARRRQQQVAGELVDHLLVAMTASSMDALPASRARAAQRLAAHRTQLLEGHGAVSYEGLARLRRAKESAVRTWVSRELARLVVVKEGRRTLLPAVQFDDAGGLRAEVAALVAPLRQAGLDGWQLWSWLVTPTSLLSGGVPAEVAVEAPERARRAAERYAAEVARRAGVAAAAGHVSPAAAVPVQSRLASTGAAGQGSTSTPQ